MSRFEEQIKYYNADQTINVTTGVDKTMYVFDCDWELRVYAPIGGVSGKITHKYSDDGSTAIV